MSNPWTIFIGMLPKTYRWIAEITAVGAGGRITVSIPGGTDAVVTNGDETTYAVGDFVFIENKTIVSKATSLKVIAQEEIF